MAYMTEAHTAPDTSVGFGLAEMAYLIQLQQTAESRVSASWLRLGDESESQELINAGLSSLIARGMATVSGTKVEFDSRVDVLAYTLAGARRWTQLDLLFNAQGGDTVLQAETDRTTLLFQPRTMMAWFVLPQDPKVPAVAGQSFIVRDHLAKNQDGGVRVRSGLERSSRQLLIRRSSAGWAHAIAMGDVVGAEHIAHSEDELTAALAAFRSADGGK
jgi:hypothetical protein